MKKYFNYTLSLVFFMFAVFAGAFFQEVNKVDAACGTLQTSKNVAVSVVRQNGNVSYDLFDPDTGYDSIEIEYKALSGEVRSVIAYKDDVKYEIYTEASSDIYCDIVCDYNNKTTYELRLYYSTGKHVEP